VLGRCTFMHRCVHVQLPSLTGMPILHVLYRHVHIQVCSCTGRYICSYTGIFMYRYVHVRGCSVQVSSCTGTFMYIVHVCSLENSDFNRSRRFGGFGCLLKL